MQILTLRAQLALEAEEERDRQHGKAVVTAADKGTRVTCFTGTKVQILTLHAAGKDAELQAEQKKRMVKEEETFRQQARTY